MTTIVESIRQELEFYLNELTEQINCARVEYLKAKSDYNLFGSLYREKKYQSKLRTHHHLLEVRIVLLNAMSALEEVEEQHRDIPDPSEELIP